MPLEINSLLHHRYRIGRVLAHGGMGAIYRATDESLGVVVAVKENLITSEDSTRQFHREATILAGLRHSNLPRVTDHFVIEGQGQYLVMDFIEGEDLKQRITRLGRLPEDEAIIIICQACDGLSYLHGLQPPVVHRDIKPGNIKITPEGQVYLVDFGLAKIARSGEQTTVGAQALTPGFAPPEQYGKGTDFRSDIYSLGATLYAALTGKTPEEGLARALGHVALIPIPVLNPQISQSIDVVVSKAVSVYPQERYQSAADFKQALLNASTKAYHRAVQGGMRIDPSTGQGMDNVTADFRSTQAQGMKTSMPTVMQTPAARMGAAGAGGSIPPARGGVVHPPSQPLQIAVKQPEFQAKKKSPLLFIILGLIVLLVIAVIAVAGGGYLVYNGLGKNPTRTAQVVAQVTPTEKTAIAVTETLTPTNEPSEFPTLTLEPTNTEVVTKILEITTTPSPTLSPTIAETSTPAVTPIGGGDGVIAFASDRTGVPQIFTMAVDGSNQTQLTKISDGACDPDWDPDGKRLVFISPCRKWQTDYYEGSRLFMINRDGSGLVPLDSMPGGDFDPAWSPDGKKIAFTSIRSDKRPHIYIYNLDDNSTTLITSRSSYDRRPYWSPDGQYLVFETTRGGKSEVWYMSADGSKPKEFSRTPDTICVMPAWSPDGDMIVYTQGTSLPWLQGRSFKDKTQPSSQMTDVRPVWDADFSKDGYWLVFYTLTEPGNRDIGRVMSNGGDYQRLTTDPGNDFHPAWGP